MVSESIKFAHSTSIDEHNDAIKGLLHCENVLHQLIEGENLLAHGCPINIELFLKDDIYRKNAIMDLSKYAPIFSGVTRVGVTQCRLHPRTPLVTPLPILTITFDLILTIF